MTKDCVSHFESQSQAVLAYSVKSGASSQSLIQAVLKQGEPTMQKQLAKGLTRRPIRVVIVGMPNVGKSSLINHTVGRKKVKTGHKAGVTRHPQWIRIHPQVELLDT